MNIYYMNNIHDNDVNNIAKCSLLHDILNPYEYVKINNCRDSPILHVWMNTRMGKAENKKFEVY